MASTATPTTDTPTPPPGLINSAPGSTTTTPGTTPTGYTGPGAPVTSYNPAQANSSNATAAATQVPDNATVSSQLNNIIASGSPLMQQAETNAKNQMNQRGLINSSQAITAGQSAVISAATPIAQQDANTYATAAQQTAASQNAATLQNANNQTATNQFNSGQSNAALSQAATASNTVAQTAQQIAGQTDVANISANVQQAVAQLQSQTNLTTEQMQTQSQQIIAGIQANTTLTAQDKQDLTQTVVAQMQASSSLANIQAQGQYSEQVAQINNSNQQLIQSDQAASSFYNQSLVSMSNILTNPNLSAAQKAQAMNDTIQTLNDGLSAISQISNTPAVQSTLTFN